MAWSIELSLQRIRDSSALAAVLKSPDSTERRWLGRQVANLLSVLPAAQAELSLRMARTPLPALQELVRQAGMLETVVLEPTRESAEPAVELPHP